MINEADQWNLIDPMTLNPTQRDRFPKTTLLGKAHLGDTYPLCSELPPQHYLKQGAKYRYVSAHYAIRREAHVHA